MALSDRMLHEGDVEALQRLLESQPEYAEQLTGYPPGPSDALSALIGVPPGFDPGRKRSLGLWRDGVLMGFADVLVGHPDPGTASIGLLLVHGRHRRQGLGRRLHQALDAVLAREQGIERLRVGVVSTTGGASEPFWAAMGYRPTGEQKPYRYDHVDGTVRIWERTTWRPSRDG